MRETKPSKQIMERKQREEQKRQELRQLKYRLKGKKQLTQDDINDLVLVMAKQQGLIEE